MTNFIDTLKVIRSFNGERDFLIALTSLISVRKSLPRSIGGTPSMNIKASSSNNMAILRGISGCKRRRSGFVSSEKRIVISGSENDLEQTLAALHRLIFLEALPVLM